MRGKPRGPWSQNATTRAAHSRRGGILGEIGGRRFDLFACHHRAADAADTLEQPGARMFFDDDFPRGGWRIERPGAQEGGDGDTLGAGFAANHARFRRRAFEGKGGHD